MKTPVDVDDILKRLLCSHFGWPAGELEKTGEMIRALAAERDEAVRKADATVDGAIRFIQDGLCKEHEARVLQQSFSEYVADQSGICPKCLEAESAALKAERDELEEQLNNEHEAATFWQRKGEAVERCKAENERLRELVGRFAYEIYPKLPEETRKALDKFHSDCGLILLGGKENEHQKG